MTPAQKATLHRLVTDFEYWCRHAYTILDKSGQKCPLILNDAQKHVLSAIQRQEAANKPVRLVLLKGRQQGISTMIEAFQIWKTTTTPGKRALVLAHVAPATDNLFAMSKRGYENLPPLLKPDKDKSNKRDLSFGKLDSSLTVATAGGTGIGRGSTFQLVHASEVAFWEPAFAEANFNGLMETMPRLPGTMMAVESTANGIGGLFHRLWLAAEHGESEFEAVFIPWFWEKGYREPVPERFERTPEEDRLVKLYGLDDNQLCFRRMKIAAKSLDEFRQEYPCCAAEAFLTSGRPVFDPLLLEAMMDRVPDALRVMALEADEDGDERFVEHSRGELTVYQSPQPTSAYYIGADVAEGVRGGDWSVAQVLDASCNQVAVWRGHILPDRFAKVLAVLGDLYNDALVAVEINNHGLSTATELSKHLAYPNVFTEVTYDKIMDEETVRLGFSTNPKTRPLILNKLRAAVRDGSIKINDKITLKEMTSFSLTPAGRMEAEAGAHDDHVMSLAIALHVNEGEWVPVRNSDDHYHEAL